MSDVLSEDDEKIVWELLEKECKNNQISRYILEGHLAYTLEFSSNRAYRVLMNLMNKKLIELVELNDGEYYEIKNEMKK